MLVWKVWKVWVSHARDWLDGTLLAYEIFWYQIYDRCSNNTAARHQVWILAPVFAGIFP